MISFWRRLLDLISPRLCVVCGHRLSVTEEAICSKCNFHLPRTGFHLNAYENEMARLFWAQVPIERATAFFYYEPHAQTANIIYELKYKNRPDIGIIIGRMLAKEVQFRPQDSSMESTESSLFLSQKNANNNEATTKVKRLPKGSVRLQDCRFSRKSYVVPSSKAVRPTKGAGNVMIMWNMSLNSSIPKPSVANICYSSMMSSPLVPRA